MAGMNGDLVEQFPTDGSKANETAATEAAQAGRAEPVKWEPLGNEEYSSRVRPAGAKSWPASVSRDEPRKLSVETRAHTFFVRTEKPGLMANIDVLGFIAKCPSAGDGEGALVHRDVIHSLGYHLLDKVHELEELRKGRSGTPSRFAVLDLDEPRYDEKLSKVLDTLGDKDAEIKELRASLGEAAVKIRRLESKIFK